MPFIGSLQGSLFSGERPSPIPPLSCSIGAGQAPVYNNIITERDISVTGASSGSVWGSNPYTEDSNMNVAAVHAGLVSVGETATITQYAPADYSSSPGYISSTRNGITTNSWTTRWCGLYLRRNPPNTLSGVANATDLKGYFGPAPNKSFRFTTTGVDTVDVLSIPFFNNGTSGLNNIVTKDFNPSITYPSLTVNFTGNVDDGWYTFGLPWSVNFLGTLYNTIYVGTNSYVTFGSGSPAFAGLNYSVPSYPKILITAADNSLQRIWFGFLGAAPNRKFFIRYEGLNAITYVDPNNILPQNSPHYPNGSYISGQGPIVWDMYFLEDAPTVIEFSSIANSKWV